MRKGRILPHLAVTGVMKNGILYFPYLFAGILSAFIWFVFSSILHNNIIASLPHGDYLSVLMQVGRVLLGIILLPFLFYANSFLIKRRKNEIGLYSILGLEKKHIAAMLILEAMLIYCIVLAGGVLTGVVFSKIAFLLLLNMTGLPIDIQFVFTKAALMETAIFFLAAYILNLGKNLIEVGKSNPIQLLGGGTKGEKELRFLPVLAFLGAAALMGGYWVAFVTKMDSTIFTDFFFAVFLVIVGTYLLFTSGSIWILRKLKNWKKFYYRSENFVTISGMLYRMKKNAASLSNICIFSTMLIITVTCTVSLYLGMDDILDFTYPNDITIHFAPEELKRNEFRSQKEIVKKAEELQDKYQIKITDTSFYTDYTQIMCPGENGYAAARNSYENKESKRFHFLTLEDTKRLWETDQIAAENEILEENEVLLFTTGPDLKKDSIELCGVTYVIKEEISSLKTLSKSQQNEFQPDIYVIFSNEEIRNTVLTNIISHKDFEDELFEGSSDFIYMMAEGNRKDLDQFIEELQLVCSGMDGYGFIENGYSNREERSSVYGGLLFIGLFFGLIFAMCLLLIMYYKQIAEGYEDQKGFKIMQQVGMSDAEIRKTIRKQIQLVFFLPLFGAVLHTLAGIPVVNVLFGSIQLFEGKLVFGCAGISSLIFLAFYAGSYLYTAKTYYKIVRM